MTAPKTIRVNPREAPKGYRAVEGSQTTAKEHEIPCTGCAFQRLSAIHCIRPHAGGLFCVRWNRKDFRNVIFKRIKKVRKP